MRSDLLALTLEGLTALANIGLVKRAQKEAEQGKGPEISEDSGGTVHGAFADGVTTRLPPGTPLREAFCSCGAAGVCRHRVAVALAYPAWHAAQQGSGGEADIAAPVGSPGEIGDDALLTRLGRKLLDRARVLARGGVSVEIRRPDATEPIATAVLPSCTVRFLVSTDPAWARCDCAARQDCEHVALAVWAFRAADARDPAAPRLIVGLAPIDPAEPEPPSALTAAVRLGEEILLTGVVHARESLAQRFALCRETLQGAGLTWPLTALDDLEETLAAYRARSARYRAERVAGLLAETAARERAGRPGHSERAELPAAFVLGRGEAMETRLDHLQLVGLGARIEADSRDREAAVYFADPDTATVLVLRRRWTFPDGEEPPDAPALGRRRAGSAATLAALAAGQIVTKVARRRADRALILGEARGGMTSVTPQAGAWESLPPPVRVTRLADLAASWKARPPRLLRPRVQAEDVHAVAVQKVEDLSFQPAAQTLVATLRDADGAILRLARPYRAVAPHALDHLAAALAGDHGPVRFVSGTIRRHLGGFEIDPLAVACDRLIVPDIVPDLAEPLGHALSADRGAASADPPVEAAAAEALGILAEGAHHGLRHAPFAYPDRLRAAAARLTAAGLTACAARLETLDATLRAARGGGEESSWSTAAAAWMDAAIRLELVREVV